jgi:hypothetical protein
MSQPTHTLPWILAFVREAMKPMGNLDYNRFFASLWMELEKAHVPGVVRTPPHENYSGQAFRYDQAPSELWAAANEAFFISFSTAI